MTAALRKMTFVNHKQLTVGTIHEKLLLSDIFFWREMALLQQETIRLTQTFPSSSDSDTRSPSYSINSPAEQPFSLKTT